jgi:hypothetical protein
MSEEYDPLEQELDGLRPLDLRAGLERRIAEQLAAEHGSRPGSNARWGLTIVAGLAMAAGLIVAVGWWPRPEPERVPVLVQPTPVHPPPRVDIDDRAPTALAYQRAWAESPEAFDALLARHAAFYGGADQSSNPPHAFALSLSTSSDFTGDRQ